MKQHRQDGREHVTLAVCSYLWQLDFFDHKSLVAIFASDQKSPTEGAFTDHFVHRVFLHPPQREEATMKHKTNTHTHTKKNLAKISTSENQHYCANVLLYYLASRITKIVTSTEALPPLVRSLQLPC